VKRIMAIVIAIALLVSFSVVSTVAAYSSYSGSFLLNGPGDTYSVAYTAADWVDLEISLNDDAVPDDVVDIKVGNCTIATLYEYAGSVSVNVSLPAGSYTINFEAVIDPSGGSPFSYTLTESEYTGNYIYPCIWIAVDIDIKPGSDPNSINLKSKGKISIAILTTDEFDAAMVDPDTVLFAGAAPVHYTMEDVDKDGDMDMILQFATQDTDIMLGDTEATLTGQTLNGETIIGTDMVRTIS
jgi:hypothetical protein